MYVSRFDQPKEGGVEEGVDEVVVEGGGGVVEEGGGGVV